jgi:NitT/TauT family transport system ATP-binding protein
MRQRAALIRILSANPDILLLDEPFSALDYQTRLSVCDDVYKIIRSEGKTALLITHDISEAISVADKIIVLSARPARVLATHDIFFPEGEPLKRRENPEFSKWFERLWKELNG